jgi:hypothetical protein
MICSRCKCETHTLIEGVCQECRRLTLIMQVFRKPPPPFIITDKGVKIKPVGPIRYDGMLGCFTVKGHRWKRWLKFYSRHARVHTFESYSEDMK